jgi:geranylgeranylglycerol-phosphate geranylgeranyltransferase
MQGGTLGVRLGGLLALTHPFPVAMTVLAAMLFAVIAARGAPPAGALALLFGSVFLSQVAIASLNDYCDRRLDAATKPWKPLPAGLVAPRVALSIAIVCTALALLCAALLGPLTLLAAIVGTAAGLAYDVRLKGTVWSAVPFLIAFPLLPIWAWSAVAPVDLRLLEGYLVGAPLVLGLHLADTLPDLEGDRAHGVRGFAHRLGPLRARYLMWAVFLVTPALLAALAALPGHAAPLLWGAGGLTLVLVHTALVISHGGPPRDGTQAGMSGWRLAFALLACATLVTGLGWLLALVVG